MGLEVDEPMEPDIIDLAEALDFLATSDLCGPAVRGYTLDELKRGVDAWYCAQDLQNFVKLFWRVIDPNEPMVPGWTLDAIADHLMAVTDGTIQKLLINVPPGFTKSNMCDVFWPAWEWGAVNRPWYRYVTASYNVHLTMRDNGKFRRILLDPLYFSLWSDIFVLTAFGSKKVENNRTGWKLATSVGGVGVGERGNRVIIDDPNNPKEVESDLVREGTNLWVREIMPDRLNNLIRDATICIQQRTHDKDVSGTLLEILGHEYTHLMIPMEYEPERHCVTVLGWEDPRGLDEDGQRLEGLVEIASGWKVEKNSPADLARGRLAWPARFPRRIVESMKTAKGPYAYSGQYQQSPTPRGGGLIQREWWRLWPKEEFPDYGTVVVSIDTAIKEGELNDWNAATCWAAFAEEETEEPQLMLRAARRLRGTTAEVAKMVGDMCKANHAEVLLIEDKTRADEVAVELRRQFADASWQTLLVPPVGDKVARVKAIQPFFSGDVRTHDERTGITVWTGGVIWAPNTTWAEDVITECERFPRGEWDDYVDTVSQALIWLRKNGVVIRPVEHHAALLEERKLERMREQTSNKPLYPA